MPPILALTLHPEWAWAVCHLGKDAENRSERFARQIDRRVGDGWLAIHAGVKRPADLSSVAGISHSAGFTVRVDALPVTFIFRREADECRITDDDLPRGAIVALAKIGDVLEPGAQTPWKLTFSAALALSPVVVLPEPIPCKGKQGLWTPPPNIQERLRAALEE
jgi:hypothetical protein